MITDVFSPLFARDVSRRNKRGRRGLVFKSLKNAGGDLRVESGLERDVGLMLDLDPRVIQLTSQPFTIDLGAKEILASRKDYRPRPGVKHRFYTPDFLCRLDDGGLLAVDAKHSRFIKEFETRRKAVEEVLWNKNIHFKLIPETAVSRIIMQTVASLQMLRAPYLGATRSLAESEISELLESRTQWLTEDLAARLTSGRVGVFAGLLAGLLTTNCSTPLFSPRSEVRAAYGDLSHLQFLELSV